MTSGKRRARRISFLAAVWALCASPLLHASGWSVPQLMAGFAGVQESRAQFREEKHLAMLTEPLVLSGTLRYVRPDTIEKRVTQPYAELLRIQRNRVEWESQGRTRVVSLHSQPHLFALSESLRGTLAGDLAALQRHYTLALEGSRARWKLTLEPRYDSLSQYVTQIRLHGQDNKLRQVEILEADGNRSHMRIEEVSP